MNLNSWFDSFLVNKALWSPKWFYLDLTHKPHFDWVLVLGKLPIK